MVARYAPPVSFNFLNLIRLGGNVKTVFEKVIIVLFFLLLDHLFCSCDLILGCEVSPIYCLPSSLTNISPLTLYFHLAWVLNNCNANQ